MNDKKLTLNSYLNVLEAARLAQVSKTAIHLWIKQGLPYVMQRQNKAKPSYLIKLSDLNNFINAIDRKKFKKDR